jgi:trans-2,3-dihydro-3-hydroxyanthranilate isomerase
MPRPFLQYDVFTIEPLTGNQLAVFPDGRGLSTDRMQAIAREMNFSESTFILPAETPDTNVRMRIFTPALEMPMAGHPTIGSTFALARMGVITPAMSRVVFGLNIGPTPVDLEWGGAELRFAWMTQRPPEFGPELDDRASVAAAVGLTPDDLAPGLPVQEVSCGVPFLMIPLRDPETVDRAVSDASAARRFAAVHPVHAFFVFAAAGEGREETVYSRMMAPHFGIAEDPATGSASGPLGCYLVRHGVVPPGAAGRILSAQGVAMKRPSRIHVSIGGTPDAITSVKVGGEAVLVATGELLVDAPA